LQTHPLSADRIAELAAFGAAQDWPAEGPRVPLPAALKTHNVAIPAPKPSP
jgi:hypothetical protein